MFGGGWKGGKHEGEVGWRNEPLQATGNGLAVTVHLNHHRHARMKRGLGTPRLVLN